MQFTFINHLEKLYLGDTMFTWSLSLAIILGDKRLQIVRYLQCTKFVFIKLNSIYDLFVILCPFHSIPLFEHCGAIYSLLKIILIFRLLKILLVNSHLKKISNQILLSESIEISTYLNQKKFSANAFKVVFVFNVDNNNFLYTVLWFVLQ